MIRVDAERNRGRLLEAALRAFSSSRGTVTLEGIATDAGVGIGTLYRHFPTREALLEAVYRNELEQLCARAGELLVDAAPDEALRAWMDGYADFVGTKRGMAEALRAVISAGTITSAQTREQLGAAVAAMLGAGADAGVLRKDVRAEDVVASLAGVLLAAGGEEPRAQVGRMLDILVDGLRPPGR